MEGARHLAVFFDNRSEKSGWIGQLFNGDLPRGLEWLEGKNGALFSRAAIERYMEEEELHDRKILTPGTSQSLKSMSSGERKKALLAYLLASRPDFLVLDNPFDNLDRDSQESLRGMLEVLAESTSIILLISRSSDLLPFIGKFGYLAGEKLEMEDSPEAIRRRMQPGASPFQKDLPPPPDVMPIGKGPLVEFRKVSVSYSGKPILTGIEWRIMPGDFWELAGPNGSGKTTLLSMITGDNPKGFGQELYLFGQRKGSGESVWDIKRQLGYFTPAMIDRFRGYHSVEHMLISGLTDSVGLYVRPTETELRTARTWLHLLGLDAYRNAYFHDLSVGYQRLVMCARAMVKHPPLLILDEPTAGLDDASAALFVSLVNKIGKESSSAIIFVSHRKEPGLKPDATFLLQATPKGSVGTIHSPNP